MLFSSITFLYYFLPVVLILYYIVPAKLKNIVLLIASLFFYFCGEPVYTLLLLFSSISDYMHSLYIEKHRGTRKAKAALVSSIVINLGMLCFFKYTDFLIQNFNMIFRTAIPALGLSLPIGISFYTFQTMSYTIDVYRGDAHAEKNLATLATYVCLFPQLVAGPIVRYTDIAAELSQRSHRMDKITYGISRFVFGLSKKVLVANLMGELCAIFRASNEKTVLFYWIYAVAFTMQIYFDFSGYSDMAIGLGHMFGFSFPENFNYPYVSKSITEFWRRWHMSLSFWFRDYVYIPLGGNRTSRLKWLRNILIVWMLTGLWHGAAWNFIVWGLFFGVLLIVEKLWLSKVLDKTPAPIRHFYVMFLVVISFVIFNADGMGQAAGDLAAMFGFAGLPFCGSETLYYLRSYAIILIVAILASTPLVPRLVKRIRESHDGFGWASAILHPALLGGLLITVTAYLVDGSFNPFLYFRF